jgi:peroxiredoxin Q/BCP
MALNVGDKAPNFTGAIDENNNLSLKDLKGKWFVLYFYPKDNTSGCTKEACSFRDNMEEITKSGVEVIGVSPDSVKSHNNFKTKFNLNFHLIADPDKTICNAYDIMGEKSMYGKKYLGVIRTTYIIDAKGIIRKVFSNVKVDGHVDEVINAIKELKK